MRAFGISVDKNLRVPMRDGVELAADLYRPSAGGPFPTLVTRTPYGKESAHYISAGNFPLPLKLAEAGYAVVVNDIRGRFDSDGDFVPYVHDAPDGYDTLEWAAAQAFSNGDTGVYGCSYLGLTTLLAAREAPPSLRCAIAMIAPANPFLEMAGGRLAWLLAQAVTNLEREGHGVPGASQQQLFDALAQECYREPWRPLATAPGISAPGVAPYFQEMIRHDRYDEYWKAASPDRDYASYKVPILHMGGWWDSFNAGTVRNFLGIGAATDYPQHLWMGPWGHQEYDRIYGEYDLGASAMLGVPRRGGGGIMRAYLEFLDRHLRGGHAELPPVTYFVVGANAWKQADRWPPAESRTATFFLHSGGRAQTSHGDGRLDLEAPESAEPSDAYRYDPADPVSLLRGSRVALSLPGPQDHREIEERRDVLCYTTAAFSEPLTIAGPVSAILWAATDAPDTDWMAKILDVFPDGRAVRLRWGHVTARFRHSLEAPTPVPPNEAIRYEIDLGSTAHRFPAGHRLRLEISSSEWPENLPNSNTGEPIATSSKTRVAKQQILHSPQNASALRVHVLREDVR